MEQKEMAAEKLEEDKILRQKAYLQLEKLKERDAVQLNQLKEFQERIRVQDQALLDIKTQYEKAIKQLDEEKGQLKEKQGRWMDDLLLLQKDVLNQKEQLGLYKQELNDKAEVIRKQQEQIAQLQSEAAQHLKKEAWFQEQAGREEQEKEKLLENIYNLQKSCEKEMIHLQKQYQGENQRLQQQIESLKKCNAELTERCRRAEAEILKQPGPVTEPMEKSVAEPVREAVSFEEGESAEQQYRKHAADVNRSIASAQERIARMLEELQRDIVTEKEQESV